MKEDVSWRSVWNTYTDLAKSLFFTFFFICFACICEGFLFLESEDYQAGQKDTRPPGHIAH